MRTDPFEELDRLTRRDRRMLAMDAVRSDEEVLVYVDVPGVTREDIELTVERNQIDLSVRRSWPKTNDERVLASERSQGVFSRQFVVGDNLATDQLKAKLENGVLTLAIPVADEAKPKAITISESSGAQPVEAAS
ncbi:MAG: Hsp20/alpha crystallin family protein [Acidimicrobiales bacterium]